jgi:TPR repeat protein/uncharacterized protein YecT (DUF1311 family)
MSELRSRGKGHRVMNARCLGFLVLVALGAGHLSVASAAAQKKTMRPSFDCANAATPVERIICADPELSQLDGRMGEVFKLKYAQLADIERRALQEGQRRWIEMWNGQCGLPYSISAKPCILELTKARVAALAAPNSGTIPPPVGSASVPHSRPLQTRVAQPLRVPQGAPPVTNCDKYAASPLDPERATGGFLLEKINPDLAIPACESAVRQYPTSGRLNYQLGRAYYKANNFSAAVEQYLKAAEKNNAPAQTNLGIMYSNGQGVAKDDTQAVTWYRKAVEQNYAAAQNNLGAMYANGQGVEKDERQAVEWYRKAAEQNIALAQNNLGAKYANGQGVEKDDRQAVAWYRKAAEQNDAQGQSNLGLMYANGRGVARDDAQAAAWYRKAAEQGNAFAQVSLGDMYDKGHGVLQNSAEAVKWWRKAADQGNDGAQNNLGVMYQRGQGITQNYAEAVKWYRMAADQGHAVAQDNLGVMYSEGHGVPPDFAEAEKWWRKAADQGNTGAQNHLAAQQVRTAQEHGYKRITFEDFMLDGKEFAANGVKVSIQGVYVKQGESEMLYPSLLAISTARERVTADGAISILTGDATRSLRKLVLDCRNNPVGAQIGCSLTVVGYVSMCTRTTLLGSTNMPCLIVEDGSSVTPR